MNTRVRLGSLTLFLLFNNLIFSQNKTLGGIPQLNLNKILSEKWRLNLKIESRNKFYDFGKQFENLTKFQHINTDYSIIFSKRIGLSNSFAGGLLFRSGDKYFKSRYIQQLTFVNHYNFFRIAQRLLLDQTIKVNTPFEIRFRYRMTFELPINGRSIDNDEWYLKLNNEFLNCYKNKKYNLEFRSSPLLGFKFSDQNKFEFGLDYRNAALRNQMSKHQFWLSLNWFIIL